MRVKVEITPEVEAEARNVWNKVLSLQWPPNSIQAPDSQLAWFGSEPVVLLELAMMFYYEESGK